MCVCVVIEWTKYFITGELSNETHELLWPLICITYATMISAKDQI
jgi:hypothetical protein